MGAIKTMKEVESALPQKKEINYVRALDKNGNPILINKEDLAQVVGELIGITTSQKNGLQKYNLIPNFSNSGGIWCIGTLPNNNFLCTFLISVNHTSFKQSGVSLLQIIGTGDENFKANYKSLIKGTQEAKFYAKYNEKGINVYVDAPANITVSILSYSHMAKDFYFNLQKQESLPEGCTQAVDVDTL